MNIKSDLHLCYQLVCGEEKVNLTSLRIKRHALLPDSYLGAHSETPVVRESLEFCLVPEAQRLGGSGVPRSSERCFEIVQGDLEVEG